MASEKNTPAKKKSPAKSTKTPTKKAAPKKSTQKKVPSKKQTAPEPAPVFRKRTIAERTVAWKSGSTANILRWLAIIPLLMLIVFFTFFMAGYSFTVLVCWCLIGILMFYNIIYLLRNKYPMGARIAKRIFTFILCVGLIVVGITEAVVIHASFGDPKESCDYVVVLGAKVRYDGPSVSLMDRIHAAADYLNTHPDAIAVVSGGQGPDEPIEEAWCMHEELIKLGIDPARIWVEDRATSTWENLQFSLDLIERKTGTRPTKIGILSSEYHLFRASLFADACGVESVGIPAATSRLSQKINHFMREVAGIWHYLILGGQYDA